MAIIRQLEHQPLQVNAQHTNVQATYSIVLDDDGVKYLQIDTYGSSERALVGKKSQTIRFSPEAVGVLRDILSKHF